MYQAIARDCGHEALKRRAESNASALLEVKVVVHLTEKGSDVVERGVEPLSNEERAAWEAVWRHLRRQASNPDEPDEELEVGVSRQ